MDVPARVRSAVDVEAIHHPWVAAQGLGMLEVEDGRAVADRAAREVDVDGWLAGLEAVLRAESHDQRGRGAAVACRVVLAVLAGGREGSESLANLADEALQSSVAVESMDAYAAFRRGVLPADTAVEVLTGFGAIDTAGRLTSLGRWALQRLNEIAPPPVTPDLPAGEVLKRLAAAADEDEVWEQAWSWLDNRDSLSRVRELLRAAGGASPAERVAAVDVVAGLGVDASPAWRDAAYSPDLAGHAKAVLDGWGSSQ